ncbi:molybdopterin-binding oxidoreductase [Minicystis rosea]|nr:molybdopterin-binding oxidoreductase [Minicystis rosea]
MRRRAEARILAGMDEKKSRAFLERKQAVAERQAARGVGIFSGMKPMGTGPENRHGMPKLPVGQSVAKKWPVLDLGDVPEIDRASFRLTIDGLCDAPTVLDWDGLMALPQTEDVSDFHCVTGWSLMDSHWGGVRFADLAAHVRVHEEARFVFVTAYDFAPGSDIPYTTNLPLAEAMEPDVMLVHTWQGKPLPVEHGGPLRMITPQLYAWKGAKWIKRIDFRRDDEAGFWEERGYSMTAYPWYDDRYRRR